MESPVDKARSYTKALLAALDQVRQPAGTHLGSQCGTEIVHTYPILCSSASRPEIGLGRILSGRASKSALRQAFGRPEALLRNIRQMQHVAY